VREDDDGGGGSIRGTGVRAESTVELRGECRRTMILRDAESRAPGAHVFAWGGAGGGVKGGWEVKRWSGKGGARLRCMETKQCDGDHDMLEE
jgi:hypothetical protein